MLKDLAEKYFYESGCNCAVSVFLAVAEDFNVEVSEETTKVVAAFGGGMGAGSTCGALTGAIAAVGLVYDPKSSYYKTIREELIKQFKERYKTLECSDLVKTYKVEYKGKLKCMELVQGALEILDDLFDEYLEKEPVAECSS